MVDCLLEIYPLHRSLTGAGVRETFRRLQHWLPWQVTEVPTGTAVFDWVIPQEWRIRDAYIAAADGTRIVDYQTHNLQVVAYSQPVQGQFRFDELRPHLHRDDRVPSEEAIPYRTAYFRDQWGFCVSRNQWQRLSQDPGERFTVCIDCDFVEGSLTYGESVFPGESDDTLLIYAHCCHPSLANDNLSGMVIATFLGRWLQRRLDDGETLLKTYRIVLAPATLGAIAWLAQHQPQWPSIAGGLVLSMLGDPRPFTYKQSRQEHSVTDRVVKLIGRQTGMAIRTVPFCPFGYDERQFCSPGVNLPMGCLMRSTPQEFDAYHTSADHPDAVRAEDLVSSLELVQQILWTMEQNHFPVSCRPYGEPQLGRYELYRAFGEPDLRGQLQEALMWILNLADGEHDLLAIAERSDLPFPLIVDACNVLHRHQLIRREWSCSPERPRPSSPFSNHSNETIMATLQSPAAAQWTHRTSAECSTDLRSCRFCAEPLSDVVVDLGLSPLCQSQIDVTELNQSEVFYPLRAYVCRACWLIQVHEHVSGREIFKHYAYFSSYSDSWLAHSRQYVDMIIGRLELDSQSHVIELASNDGYLLQNFVARGISCLGIEPATNVAEVAIQKGVPVLNKFFGVETANELVATGRQANLVIANNVLAHVPDLNDFVAGIKIILAPGGSVTVEFPHAQSMIELNQFDTIYQEHYCYFLLSTLQKVFAHHGLTLYDVEKLPTHGGSLRIYVGHAETVSNVTDAVRQVEQEEEAAGLQEMATYHAFAERVKEVKWSLLEFLISTRRQGKVVVGYGAPGKGNTLLNYCGIREDLLDYTVDRNPFKQNSFLVGSRIPVYAPEVLAMTKPDFVLVLPWNLRTELEQQLKYVREWGGKLVFAIPRLEVV